MSTITICADETYDEITCHYIEVNIVTELYRTKMINLKNLK
jgi:hypothetical protein